ncbi:hypothetical protein [Cellulosimicrobium marinum]|uniref:hypothetical protein n=1 Tax=Cellulosimicrobium marinum TaxID=1638992 RepID=UPI001E28A0AA|nr:hypothetical protein [Cellulosimicrobium marinum]MCB7135601.1 hypothetical protein [Cellulosimicrobium marinum]
MVSPVAGPLRLARAALVATLVLAVTAGAHALGGGHLPDPLVLAALGAFTLAGTTAAARHRFTVPRLVGVLGGAQLGLHLTLDALGHGAVACTSTGAGHSGHGGVVCPTVADAAAPAVSAVAPVVPGTAMFLAHVAATLVLAVVLARGEQALVRLVAWLAPRPVVLDPVALPVARAVRAVGRTVHGAAARHPGTAPTRGPPPGGLVGSPA